LLRSLVSQGRKETSRVSNGHRKERVYNHPKEKKKEEKGKRDGGHPPFKSRWRGGKKKPALEEGLNRREKERREYSCRRSRKEKKEGSNASSPPAESIQKKQPGDLLKLTKPWTKRGKKGSRYRFGSCGRVAGKKKKRKEEGKDDSLRSEAAAEGGGREEIREKENGYLSLLMKGAISYLHQWGMRKGGGKSWSLGEKGEIWERGKK